MGSDMKILLMSPAKTDEPLGLMYISSILKENGFKTKGLLFNKSREYESTLLSSLGDDDNFQRIVMAVDDYKPDVIFFSVITGEHNQCISINSKLKKTYNYFSSMNNRRDTHLRPTYSLSNPFILA